MEIDAKRIETFNYTAPPLEWNGPGLVLVFKLGSEAAVAVLAASSGLLPDWIDALDDTGQSKLATLAQELGTALLPAEQLPEELAAGYVDKLSEAIHRGGVSSGAGAIHCLLKSGDKSAALRLVWPATSPEAILSMAAAEDLEPSSPMPTRKPAVSDDDLGQRLRNLPSYVRSLLRIRVPVSVHLASIRQPVSRVLNIGPGTIIQFEKNCEQPLTLCIGNQPVAEGEAVKVGEKFGVKLTQMILPGERFAALKGKKGVRGEG